MEETLAKQVQRLKHFKHSIMIYGDESTNRVEIIKAFLDEKPFAIADNFCLSAIINKAYAEKLTIVILNLEELSPENQEILNLFVKDQKPHIISGASYKLEEEVAKGNFSEELFYRLNTIVLRAQGYRWNSSDFDELQSYKNFNPDESLYEVERKHILKMLEYYGGDKAKAANGLGLTIKTLYGKLHQYGELNNLKLVKD